MGIAILCCFLSFPPLSCLPVCLPLGTVMPTIEKLLSSDWKERLLGRNAAETKEVKGEVPSLPPRCPRGRQLCVPPPPAGVRAALCILVFRNQNVHLIFWGEGRRVPAKSLF